LTVEQVNSGTYWASGAGEENYAGDDGYGLVGWDGVWVVEFEESNLAEVYGLSVNGSIVSQQ